MKVQVKLGRTGVGKTEKIKARIIKVLLGIHKTKLTVVCPDIKEMDSIIDWVRRELQSENYNLDDFINKKDIVEFHEAKIKEREYQAIDVHNAKVLITHAYYLSYCGSTTNYYMQLDWILARSGDIVIDEGHDVISKLYRNDIDIGAIYSKLIYDDGSIFYAKVDKERFTYDELKEHMENGGEWMTKVKAYLDQYKHIYFKTADEVFPEKNNYIDFEQELNTKWERLVPDKNNGHYTVSVYANKNVKGIEANHDKTRTRILDKTINACEYVSLTKFHGDSKSRPNCGRVIMTMYSTQLLSKIIHSFDRVIFVSATWSDLHNDILKQICNFEIVDLRAKMTTIKSILIVVNDKPKPIIYDLMIKLRDRRDIEALMFMNTIDSAKSLYKRWDNAHMFTKDGILYSQHTAKDQGQNRNVITLGLESSGAKGTNFKSEVAPDATNGIQVVYIESFSVSNPIKNWCVINGQLNNYEKELDLNITDQAVGRIFRLEKKVSVIYIDKDKDGVANIWIEEFKKKVDAKVIVKYGFSNTDFDIIFANKEINKDNYEQLTNTSLYRELLYWQKESSE